MAMQLKSPSMSILKDNLKFNFSEMLAFLPNDDTWEGFTITHFKLQR